jgi:hypothetical protein
MMAQDKETDAAAEFRTWTAAQAIQNSKGCGTTVPQTSRIKPVDAIAEKFRVGKSQFFHPCCLLNHDSHTCCLCL